jgi:2-polyprenyl-6-methoxyphenol hydroxylase-like FAD-dependent oxidoreductase
MKSMSTTCCIAGGGPAGMMLGWLLARAGVDVVVLEKHADFNRDFRGDTVHPATMELMWELGVLDEFLQRPHQEFSEISAQVDDFRVTVVDASHLPVHKKALAIMPQWDFLNFVAEQARQYPHFKLQMQAEVTGLLRESERVAGVRAKTPQGEIEVRAALTVGCDGRHSVVRQAAGLEVIDRGAPIDVLWMKLSRRGNDPEDALGHYRQGRILVTLNRGDYWQCAYVIPKGQAQQLKQRGLEALRHDVAFVAPFLRDRTSELQDWDKQVSLLTVAVDYLPKWWQPGLLCIGDAAHAMSPVGGVGINLAIQDAVATANLLWKPLRDGKVTADDLKRVQQRREFPTRVTQQAQVFIHRKVLDPALQRQAPLKKLPLPLKLLDSFPLLRRIPARLVGMGARPEHVRTPKADSR